MYLLGNKYVYKDIVKNSVIAKDFRKRDVYENEKRYINVIYVYEVTLFRNEYMVHVEAVAKNEAGIHCRPSAMLIQERAAYDGYVMVHSESGSSTLQSLWSVLCLV